MHIGVIGAGYVGLVTGACLADTGNKVTLVDVDREKVDCINRGIPPIHEEGLEELLRRNQHRITASTSYHDLNEAGVLFICVGTPSAPDGSINLRYVEEAAGTIAGRLGDSWKLIVVKSTVIPGTTEEMVRPQLEKTGNRAGADFGLAMNPEFLREGKAVSDFQRPDRIVIGITDQRSEQLLRHLYAHYDAPLLVTTPTAAEMIKYASNALLATKISYANEIGNYCKQLGVDVYDVMAGVGMDHRISPHFLNAGAGFGGSCFPKDVRALISAGTEAGLSMELLRAVMDVNQRQPLRMLDLLEKHVGSLEGKRIAVLGLAFKPGTDDVRESCSLLVIEALLERGAVVVGYDPLAGANMQKHFPDILYAESARDALHDADGCLLMTDWDEFRKLDFGGMARPVVIDGRRLVDPERRQGLTYEGICW